MKNKVISNPGLEFSWNFNQVLTHVKYTKLLKIALYLSYFDYIHNVNKNR